MFFSKKAPKRKGGCLDTLDTPWIRHCKYTAVVVAVLLHGVDAVAQVDVLDVVRPVLHDQAASLAVERVERGVDGAADL